MFKRFLLLFPYFQRLEKRLAEEAERQKERDQRGLELFLEEKRLNDLEDAWQTEQDRKQSIRESLLENQKFLKLRISRQTF